MIKMTIIHRNYDNNGNNNNNDNNDDDNGRLINNKNIGLMF